MLEGIAAVTYQGLIYRFVNQAKHIDVLRKMGLDGDDINEMVSLLQERGITDDPSDVLDGPFAHKPLLKAIPTRFSDGRVRVFYSALEVATAEREMQHWCVKLVLAGQPAPPFYYRCIQCTFTGEVKDLRPLVGDWPFLIADDGYDQCNRIGAEAAASGVGGLLSQSARRAVGTTCPVFFRPCLSDVEFREYRVFVYDHETNSVTVRSP